MWRSSRSASPKPCREPWPPSAMWWSDRPRSRRGGATSSPTHAGSRPRPMWIWSHRARCCGPDRNFGSPRNCSTPSSSTLIGATTVKGTMDDIFALEDAIDECGRDDVVELPGEEFRAHAGGAGAAGRARQPQGVRTVPARHGTCRRLTETAVARDLFQRAVDGSAVCAGVGGARPLPSRLRQVLRGPRHQRSARSNRVRAGVGALPRSPARTSLPDALRVGGWPRRRCDSAIVAARRHQSPRRAAVRRPGARVPLRRTARRVDGGPRRSRAAGSERRDRAWNTPWRTGPRASRRRR